MYHRLQYEPGFYLEIAGDHLHVYWLIGDIGRRKLQVVVHGIFECLQDDFTGRGQIDIAGHHCRLVPGSDFSFGADRDIADGHPVGTGKNVHVAGGDDLAAHHHVILGVDEHQGRIGGTIQEVLALDLDRTVDADILTNKLNRPLRGDQGTEVVDLAAGDVDLAVVGSAAGCLQVRYGIRPAGDGHAFPHRPDIEAFYSNIVYRVNQGIAPEVNFTGSGDSYRGNIDGRDRIFRISLIHVNQSDHAVYFDALAAGDSDRTGGTGRVQGAAALSRRQIDHQHLPDRLNRIRTQLDTADDYRVAAEHRRLQNTGISHDPVTALDRIIHLKIKDNAKFISQLAGGVDNVTVFVDEEFLVTDQVT